MIVGVYIAIVAVVIGALIISRKRNVVDIRETTYEPPTRIDRIDFSQYDQEILMVAFTSSTCDSCVGVLEKANAASTPYVGLVNVVYEDSHGKKLHEKYQIDAVPTLVISDALGSVSHAYVGHVTAADLWSALARARGDEVAECEH